MMQSKDTLFEDERLTLFKAVQEGQLNVAQTILAASPSLINAKTNSKGSSLLHIAAQRGHFDLCKFLLEKGHATNPLNVDEQTPYQLATNANIKALLVDAHLNALCQQFYTTPEVSARTNSIQVQFAPCLALDRPTFIARLKSNGADDDMANVAFGVSIPRDTPTQGSSCHTIATIFCEEILMIPYYGELLVIHENEVALQFVEQWENCAQSATPIEMQKLLFIHLNPLFETRAFAKFVFEGLKRYPFLSAELTDLKGLQAEVYKMFLTFGLIGLGVHMQNCSASPDKSMIQFLNSLPYYNEAIEHALKVLAPANVPKNKPVIEEMCAKYTQSITTTPRPPM